MKRSFASFWRRNLGFARLAIVTNLEYRVNYLTDAILQPGIATAIELALWYAIFAKGGVTEMAGFGRESYIMYALWGAFVSRLTTSWMYEFRMIEEPGAVWDDTYNPNRTSAGRKGARLLPWIEQMKPFIPSQAYYGALGWAIAKGVAVTKPLTALRYYLNAVLRGCYKPRLAAIIFLQIFLPDGLYRRIADRAIPFVPRRGVSA